MWITAVAGVTEVPAGDTTVSALQQRLGGVLAHSLTFSAVRRTLAIGALASAGITDLGAGDPISAVGGTGDDASTITRNFR